MTMHLPLPGQTEPRATPPRLERSVGAADVALRAARSGPGARLDRLYQSGSAKAVPLITGSTAEVAFLNTSGGLAGGDRLSYALTLGGGAIATATTQTAERAYRAGGDLARVEVRLSVGAGGHLDWLPQETILFDGARLSRRTVLDLGPGASCLLAETVILGRQAMGETVTDLDFTDWREVRQDDRPLWLEPLRLTPATLDGTATLAGARALASVALIGAGVQDRLAPLRAVLDESGVTAAASALPGRLMLRMMAGDGWPLRRQMVRALAVLRPGRALPRVWQM